jgi:hypothetical protein
VPILSLAFRETDSRFMSAGWPTCKVICRVYMRIFVPLSFSAAAAPEYA